ncbi:MAG TPA: polymorphic toxin-type HINT domain-containing protein [Isosphaeraceae bacterium]|nr:polymorphic toxin-type HINT domain-containing protein [Isosphaeraceae bacterium]
MHLKRRGWIQRDIAEALDVSEVALSGGLARARDGGPEALRSRSAPGRPPRLSPAQRRSIPELLWHGRDNRCQFIFSGRDNRCQFIFSGGKTGTDTDFPSPACLHYNPSSLNDEVRANLVSTSYFDLTEGYPAVGWQSYPTPIGYRRPTPGASGTAGKAVSPGGASTNPNGSYGEQARRQGDFAAGGAQAAPNAGASDPPGYASRYSKPGLAAYEATQKQLQVQSEAQYRADRAANPLKYIQWPTLNDVANGFNGFGDAATGGLTQKYRQMIGADGFTDYDSPEYAAGHAAGTVIDAFLPCGKAKMVLRIAQATSGAIDVGQGIAEGDYKKAAEGALNLLDALFDGPCFAAGTPILTPGGCTPIEELEEGDWVLALPEDDPAAVPVPRRVVNLFANFAPLLDLRVGGRVIRTTAEHPFWVRDKGWTDAQQLVPGVELLSADGRWVELEALEGPHAAAAVYNVEVEGYHTYFVGDPAWGFAAWAHNAKRCKPDPNQRTLFNTGNPAAHGNSLNTTKPAIGYTLRDKTGRILKYGETTQGVSRYTKKFLKSKGAIFTPEMFGSKAQAHAWQHRKILEYKRMNGGLRPDLNRNNY